MAVGRRESAAAWCGGVRLAMVRGRGDDDDGGGGGRDDSECERVVRRVRMGRRRWRRTGCEELESDMMDLLELL